MPALHSAGIRVRLATVPLEQTLTPNLVLKKGEVAAKQCEEAEAQLRKSEFLDEECVAFPGDEEGFSMNWLGGAPCLMARAGDDVKGIEEGVGGMSDRGSSASGRANDESVMPVEQLLGMSTRTRRGVSVASTSSIDNGLDPSDSRHVSRPSTRAHPHTLPTINPAHLHLSPALGHAPTNIDPDPKALVLHVILTDKTFYESIAGGSPQHIKIDVLFNGQLSSCVLVHQNDVRAGAKSLHQIFAGNRVDFMAERPWVIYPLEKRANAMPRGTKETISVQGRWDEISRALMEESNARGVKADGERPPSAQYLEELANMNMPDAVLGMQKPGGRTFGVVDVIVTVGIGKKTTSGVGYAKTPMRLVDEQYPFEVDEEGKKVGENQKELAKGGQERSLADGNSGLRRDVGGIQVDGQDERIPSAPLNAKGETEVARPGLTAPISSATRSNPWPLPFAAPPPIFQNPFTGASIPTFSPSGPYIYPSYPSISSPLTATGTSRGPSAPPSRKRLHSEISAPEYDDQAPSTERGQRHAGRRSFPSAHAPASAPRIVKPPTTPSPQLNFNQYDSFTHADPYQLPYSDMMVGLEMSGLPGLDSFDGSAASPLRDQASGQLVLPTVPSFGQQGPDHMPAPDPTSISFASSPFPVPGTLPSQARRVSFGQANVASFSSGAPPNEITATASMPIGGLHNFPGHTYSSSPLAQHSFGPQAPQPYFHMSSFVRQPSGPDPPIGLFKPTQKPKTRRAVPVDPGLIDISQPRPSILVRRLSITGMNGLPVVDHRWETPQRIVASRAQVRSSTSSGSSSRSRRESPGSSDYVVSASKSRRKRGTASTIATPPPTSPTKTVVTSKVAMDLNKIKRDSVHDRQVALRSNEPQAVKPVPIPNAPVNDYTTAPSSDAKGGRGSAGAAATTGLRKTVTTRRTQSSGILGVQGPKASVFVFDDPEELLRRKGPKFRSFSRSISPTKVDAPPAGHIAVTDEHVEVKEDASVVNKVTLDLSESSPLSSLPASPNMQPSEDQGRTDEVMLLSLVGASGTTAPSSSLPSAALPSSSSFPLPPTRSDSSMQHAQVSTTVAAPASSHKLAATSMPPPPPSTPTIFSPIITTSPMPPPSTTRNNRRTTKSTARHRPGPQDRQPRSPTRVSTAGNPPMSQNCIIQLAQSGVGLDEAKGKIGEGLLRQVKSERQGVFSEESVVVGVRFFVGA